MAQSSPFFRQQSNHTVVTKTEEGKAKSDLKDLMPDTQLASSEITFANYASGDKRSVRFVAVSVKSSSSKPQLTWQVAEEKEVVHYTIERSYNGSFFEEGGRLPFKPASTTINTYVFLDQNVAAEEEVYYRVRQVDSNGRYMYSQIVSLKQTQSTALQLVPNPAYDKTSVQVESSKVQKGWLQLADPSGAVVHKQAITLKKGSNKLALDGLQQYGNGTYYVQIVLPGGTLYKKLLLQ